MSYDNISTAGTSTTSTIVSLIIVIIVLAASWKMFSKAGESGWKCIIPIYNVYTWFGITFGKENAIKFLFLLVPFYNIYVMIKWYIALAKAFGKGGWFTVGMIFLPFIFFPIIGFGSAQYAGPQQW